MLVQTKEDKNMKFERRAVYTTDGNTHRGTKLEYKDVLDIYMQKDDSSVRKFNASNNVRLKAVNIAFTECDDVERYGYIPAKLVVNTVRDDKRFRKPPRYEYLILPSKDVLIYECEEIRLPYNVLSVDGIYRLQNIYSVKEESRPLLDMVYGCGEVINIEEKELKQLLKNHYDSFFKYRHTIGYEELWAFQDKGGKE